MVIYTKKGDRGKTGFYSKSGCGLVWKDDLRVDALGAVDEVNSYLGVIVSESEDKKLNEILKDVQRNLLRIGSIVGGAKLTFSGSKTNKLERIIDEIEGELPKLKNFILPGGSRVAAKLHYARSLTRKAERAIVGVHKKERINMEVLRYFNRLSDTLFVMARSENNKVGAEEEVWEGKRG